MHASQIQGFIVEQRVIKKKIAEFVWVHAVTVQTGKVAGQCAVPMPRWPV